MNAEIPFSHQKTAFLVYRLDTQRVFSSGLTALRHAGSVCFGIEGADFVFVDRVLPGDWRVLTDRIVRGEPVQIFDDITEPWVLSAEESSALLIRAVYAAIGEIDTEAEIARTGAMTPGAGQAREYEIVLSQAREVLADPSVPPESVLMIHDGALASRRSLEEEARAVVAAAEDSARTLAQIRAARLRAKSAVRSAATLEEVERTVGDFKKEMKNGN